MKLTTFFLLASLGLINNANSKPVEKRQDQGTSAAFNCNTDFALTFDDGPYTYANELVDSFSNANQKMTRFLNGNNWGCIYDDANVQNIKYAYEKGHLIGSHGWSHASFNDITREQLESEINHVEDALMKIIGVKPAFVRPPYGAANADVVDYLESVSLFLQHTKTYFNYFKQRGYTVVQWSEDSRDSAGAPADESIQTIKDLAGDGKPHLILDHEVYQSTVEQVVPGVLPTFDGKKLATVAECLGKDAYQQVAQASERDDTWTCSDKPQIKAPVGSNPGAYAQ